MSSSKLTPIMFPHDTFISDHIRKSYSNNERRAKKSSNLVHRQEAAWLIF